MKERSISKLKNDLDKLVSLFVRQSSADQHGIAICYTCDNSHEWKYLQCGHHVSRNNSATRYDLDNLRTQCAGCNVWGRGKQHIFGFKLMNELGQKRYKALLARGQTTHQFTRQELQALIDQFKAKLDQLTQ